MIRLASAAVLIAVVLTTLWVLPPWTTAMLAAALAGVAGGEVARLSGRLGADVPEVFVGLASATVAVAFVIPVVAGPAGGAEAIGAALLALLVASGAITLALGPPTPATLTRAAVMVLAPVYVGLPLGALIWVHWVAGPGATTWVLGTIAISDSAQYYTGRSIGKRKLAPAISPGKTVEGAVGGLVAAALAGAILGVQWLPAIAPAVASLLAVVLAAFGMVGDLFESALKRSAGVKDSAGLIPGHGGVLDRIDGYLFAAPVFYLFLKYIA